MVGWHRRNGRFALGFYHLNGLSCNSLFRLGIVDPPSTWSQYHGNDSVSGWYLDSIWHLSNWVLSPISTWTSARWWGNIYICMTTRAGTKMTKGRWGTRAVMHLPTQYSACLTPCWKRSILQPLGTCQCWFSCKYIWGADSLKYLESIRYVHSCRG